MRPLTFTFLLLGAGAALNAHAASPSPELAARIARVENGLLDPVAVAGEPTHTMRLLDRMHALHVPGVSIAVINHGAIDWAAAYGQADAASGRPLTTDSLFSAASVGKSMAAVLAMRLAATGKIDLDEDVNRRLRHWQVASAAGGARPVTPRSLLSHTAGMPGFGLLGYAKSGPVPTLPQVLAGAVPASNPPAVVERTAIGHYVYSGLGYTVLEQYIDDATGQTFADLARDRVLKPAGMLHSLYASTLPASLAPHAALGHELDGSVIAGGWRVYPELAAAGLWTTASDLARFAIAMQQAGQGHHPALLTQAQASAMLTAVDGDYGLGFELDHQGKQLAFHHSGSNAGYKALMFAYTSRDQQAGKRAGNNAGQGAVILTNGDGGWPLIEALMRSIAAEYGWEDYQPVRRQAVPQNPALFGRFIGTFNVSNITVQISRDQDHLYIAGPPIGPVAVQLIAAGDSDYFIREKDLTVHFDANGNAPVETLTMVDGRARAGKRIKPAS